ncbi:MAG: DNRLRE domain-containing protein [Pseudomonadales bacterium]|nr:DNRLRE domain-containing protein [Pseudomonadales bacterium]
MILSFLSKAGLLALTCLWLTGLANAGTATLYPVQDVTLIEHSSGALANGAGGSLFAGRTGQSRGGLRRGAVQFDVASALPPGAIITAASLRLFMLPSNQDPATVRLHRLLQRWHEGSSVSDGGSGAPASEGDTTWLHTDYATAQWKKPGGHYVARSSADTVVGSSAVYVWSDKKMLTDLRSWQHSSRINFGWLIIGDEDQSQSVKKFASREAGDNGKKPVLIIEYIPPRRR